MTTTETAPYAPSAAEVTEVRVLLVEDNLGDARWVELMLEDATESQYRVSHATTLADGLARLAKDGFDVVLLDLGLPDSSGIETFTGVRDGFPSLPVVILSGNADERLALAAVEMGAQDHLNKGNVDTASLTRAIRYARGRQAMLTSYTDAAADVLQEYTDALEQSNTELAHFATIAAHDLQEPLRKVRTFGDMLMASAASRLEPQEVDYIERMTNATTRMSGLISDLLSYARITTRGKPFVPVDLGHVMEAVVADLPDDDPPGSSTIEVGSLPEIIADPDQMYRLFVNLLSNALKYRHPDRDPHVEVVATVQPPEGKRPGSCEVTISDNGIGFSPEHAERIFEPFQRLHGKGEYPGSGIGLAVCRKIVLRHHGLLVAHGSPDQGASFVVTLPLHQADDRRQGTAEDGQATLTRLRAERRTNPR